MTGKDSVPPDARASAYVKSSWDVATASRREKEMTMTVAENKELLKKAAQALNHREDRTGWFDFHAESVQAHGLGPTPLDKTGMMNFYAALLGGFPDLTIHIDELVGEGDKVVWRITASGTHNGPFQGVPATGKSVKFGAHYTFRLENGKIVERWSTLDRLTVLVQIGAVALPSPK
jgi:steroid delta-isomerase-like uncharacterized protein